MTTDLPPEDVPPEDAPLEELPETSTAGSRWAKAHHVLLFFAARRWCCGC